MIKIITEKNFSWAGFLLVCSQESNREKGESTNANLEIKNFEIGMHKPFYSLDRISFWLLIT